MAPLLHAYVGPAAIRDAAATSAPGTAIRSRAELAAWLKAHASEREPGGTPATFVITPDGLLRIASRRSEHVACAAGHAVLAAGEIVFDGAGGVAAVSNLSTGYCPRPESWLAVRAALDAWNFDDH